jgi:tetratricopeptide (TPR) repeat protein
MEFFKEKLKEKCTLQEAVDFFTGILEGNPQNVDCLLHRGFYYFALNKFQKAIGDFNRVIELEPGNRLARCLRGLLHGRLGNHEKSIQDFNRSLQADPSFALTHMAKALVEGGRGEYDNALQYLKVAGELDESNPRIYLYRGDLLCRKKEFEAAIKEFYTAHKLAPEMAHHIRRLIRLTFLQGGFHHAEKGEYKTAIKYYRLYLQENPQGANAYFYLGEAYMNLEDHRSARINLMKAVDLSPDGKVKTDAHEMLEILNELSEIDGREKQQGQSGELE